jgi:hypothetical protein
LWPLVQQRHTFDYFVSLTTDAVKAYRSGYMNDTTWDTAAFGSALDKDCPTILPTPNAERIRHIVCPRPPGKPVRPMRHIAVQDFVDVDANAAPAAMQLLEQYHHLLQQEER